MNDRDKLIKSIQDAITELKVRRDDPNTSDADVADIDARLAQLEAQLAQIESQDVADAAGNAALASPSAQVVSQMRKAAKDLDDAVAQNKRASAVLDFITTGIEILAT